MKKGQQSKLVIAALSVTLLTGTFTSNPSYAHTKQVHHKRLLHDNQLSLGYSHLKQSEQTKSLSKGVTYTHIVRGKPSKHDYYTVNTGFYQSKKEAEIAEKKLKKLNYNPRLHKVDNSLAKVSDIHEKVTGYVVQIGEFQNEQTAQKLADKLMGEGFTKAGTTYSAFDGTIKATGPWDIRVLEINPKEFKGKISPALADGKVTGKETVSNMVKDHHAIAGVNGGYFVVGPNDGTPGDLAGISMINGQLLSESVGNRSSLVLTGHGAEIAKTSTQLALKTSDGKKATIDGLNRKPGLIRSCGGTNDQPTNLPEQDVTCTDNSEIIAFDQQFGKETPSGKGYEIVLNKDNQVIGTQSKRGTVIPEGGHVLSATGSKAKWLKANIHKKDTVTLNKQVKVNGMKQQISPDMSIVNGGPHLLVNGRINIDAKEEGFDWSNEFYYHFGLYRQPRTLVGIKPNGNILLVTVDGRDPNNSIGVSFLESAKLMKSLGAVQAMNLDGGGSSTMAIGGKVVNHPSDETGERPVGDGLLITKNEQ